MPYPRIEDLPQRILAELPRPPAKVYKEAFNAAWERRAGLERAEREAVADRAGWQAVRRVYHREGAAWVHN